MDRVNTWTEWKLFPNPQTEGMLHAPIGPGVYELRRRDTRQPILIGASKNCAFQMSSLLPKPLGTGVRNNHKIINYVARHIDEIEYRCSACANEDVARQLEAETKGSVAYLYPS